METAQTALDSPDQSCAPDAAGIEAAPAPAMAPAAAAGASSAGSNSEAAAASDEAQLAWEQSRTAWEETQAAWEILAVGLANNELASMAEILAEAARDSAGVVVARATRPEREAEQFRTHAVAARQHSERALLYAESALARRKAAGQSAAPDVSPEPIGEQR